MQRISKNQFKQFRSLSAKKYRLKYRKFLIEGAKLIEEAFLSPYRVEMIIYRIGSGKQFKSTIELAKKYDVPCLNCSEDEIRKISDVESPQGIAAVVIPPEMPEVSFFPQSRLILAADRISDPGNLGAIIRSAVWFGCGGLILDTECVELFSPKVVRSAMGALFHLPVLYNTELTEVLNTLKESGFTLTAATTRGTDVRTLSLPEEKNVLILGNEAHGIREQVLALCENQASIIKTGLGESLNVAVSAGIMLWEMAGKTK